MSADVRDMAEVEQDLSACIDCQWGHHASPDLKHGERCGCCGLAIVEGAATTYRRNDEGLPVPVIELAECGDCRRVWNDAATSQWTPAPAARCPFEYEHAST